MSDALRVVLRGQEGYADALAALLKAEGRFAAPSVVQGGAASAGDVVAWIGSEGAEEAAGCHAHVVVHAGDAPADVARRCATHLRLLRGAEPWFQSTRGCGGCAGHDFHHVVKSGMAEDGGLFLPCHVPAFSHGDLHHLAAKSSYQDAAVFIVERFAPDLPFANGIAPPVLRELVDRAYAAARWEDAAICPIRTLSEKTHVLELFHGPTAAFKDFALQFFPKFFGLSTQGSASKFVVLAATSGDTGVAAINGFMQEKGMAVMVLYPKDGVSAVQKAQMLACDGGNVRVLGVDADFDFCQTTVKNIFNNRAFGAELKEKESVELASANSINWGRLLPQIVYYIYAYARLMRDGKIKAGDPVDVVVPTGNFGNILSAYIARMCGIPFRHFVCASNENNVLTSFIDTGVYHTATRGLKVTASPSIDILKSSNIERFVYLLSGRDSALVAGMMADLDKKGEFALPEAMTKEMQGLFQSGFCTEAECLATIKSVQEEHGYLMDTHTAVGYKVLLDYKRSLAEKGMAEVPTLLAATASFAKFPGAVLEALDGKSVPSYGEYDAKSVCEEIKSRVGAEVPRALAAIIGSGDKAPSDVRTCAQDEGAIMQELKAFCHGL